MPRSGSVETPKGLIAGSFAPAKINLTLHVTGQRADGHHLLDSLVVFADVGDRIEVADAERASLTVTGPFAADIPSGMDNLVAKAATLIGGPPVAITLQKNLPAASGIGGGSADAAAALRAIADLRGLQVPGRAVLAALGADVPVCLASKPCRMSGIGERLDPLKDLPPLHLVLANPLRSVSTASVFKALAVKTNPPMPAALPAWIDAAELAHWLRARRNDLETPARTLEPAIGVALARLAQTEGCLMARMSGSGATCFGLYATRPEAAIAAKALSAHHPDWWITPTSTHL